MRKSFRMVSFLTILLVSCTAVIPIVNPKEVSKIIVYSGDGHFISDTSVKAYYIYNIPVNSKGQLVAKVIFNDGSSTYDVKWENQAPDKLRIENGIIYSINKGYVYINISSKQEPKKNISVTFNIFDPNDPCINPPKEQYTEFPLGQTGQTASIAERATIIGKVYDQNNVTIDGAIVTAKSVDPCIPWEGEEQTTIEGAYVLRNVPVGSKIQITATKGKITITRTEALKSNLTGDPNANRFDFSGIYALEVSP